MVDREGCELSVVAQTHLLDINRSSLYYAPVDRDPAEAVIKNAIDEIYTRRPFYGKTGFRGQPKSGATPHARKWASLQRFRVQT